MLKKKVDLWVFSVFKVIVPAQFTVACSALYTPFGKFHFRDQNLPNITTKVAAYTYLYYHLYDLYETACTTTQYMYVVRNFPLNYFI